MKYLQYVLGALLLCVYVIHADTTYVSSDIDTTTVWSRAGSPYLIMKTIRVDAGCTLTIEPGVDVLFYTATGNYAINVDGHLIAEGTENDLYFEK